MMSPLLALAEQIPNEEAIALSPTLGWLMLLCASIFALLLILHRETWRRLWLRAEDPRALGLFRIVFGLMCLGNITNLWPLSTYLFTDEGLFFTDVARRVFANQQFMGFGDGFGDDVPYGFFGLAGLIEFFKGPKFSLLYFWDSPLAYNLHFAAFEVACLCLIFGFKTRYTKWIAWFLFHSTILRNNIFWEGTENVYRCFLFYLCVSRCGRAYSVDNWLRCRRLRRQGLLSERDGPGGGAGLAPCEAHPRGLEAIYRRIPSWPRVLMMLQLGALYCYTGVVKNGPVWHRGDAFYYALNLDHFYRFEPQQLSAVFGTNVFRLMTWVTHYWEACFPLVIVGVLIRFHRREQIPRLEGWMLWAARVGWVALGLGCGAVAYVALPVHVQKGWTLAQMQRVFAGCWLGGMAVIGGLWVWLRYAPPCVTIRGRAFTLDTDWFCRWFLGRRVWLTLGLIFHTHLILLMNIGWFTPATMSTYIALLHGEEVALILANIGRRLARVGVPMPEWVRRGERPIPCEDPRLPHLHRDAAVMPRWVMATGLGVAIVGVAIVAYFPTLEDGALKSALDVMTPWRRTGYVLVGLLAIGGYLAARDGGRAQLSKIDPFNGRPRVPWAYRPLGRFLVSALVSYHIMGVGIWLLPDKDCISTWSRKARGPFKWWLSMTQTTQGWKMFAPNPPRSNLFMRVLVTDQDDQVLDLNTDVYHPANKPIPWIWYTRQRKINRRIVGAEGGKGSWYQKWHARYICREWARTHDGVPPKKVDLVKIWYSIPKPEWVKEHGAYDPEKRYEKHNRQKYVYTATCATDINAQLPDHIRARYGLPPLSEITVKVPVKEDGEETGEELAQAVSFKPWEKHRKRDWENKMKARRERGYNPWWSLFGGVSVLVFLGAAWFRWRELDLENEEHARRASEGDA